MGRLNQSLNGRQHIGNEALGPIDSENSPSEEKICRKCTYPPPADGVCVLFLCKARCIANEPVAQAGRGALRAIGNFTDCKVLKEDVRACTLCFGSAFRGAVTEMPSPLGRKARKLA